MRSVSACLCFLVAKTHFGKVHSHVEKFLPGVSVAEVIEALDRGRHEGGQEHVQYTGVQCSDLHPS